MVKENATEQNGQEVNPEPVFTLPPIAGFWRRFFAWFLDCILIGTSGQIINAAISFFSSDLGRYGYLAGLLSIIAYFGILNSKMGGGQTLGKRLLKIAVRSKNNEPIGLIRSLVRSAVLVIPVLFDDWSFQSSGRAWFLSLLTFGVGGAILYTLIFNRGTRQGIHDLLVGTYVVHLPGKPIGSFPTTPRRYYKVAGLWIGFVAITSLALLLIVPPLLKSYRANAPRRPLPYDCLALMRDKSVVALSNVTYRAYRSHDGGITWSRDGTVESLPHCSVPWPARLETEPPIAFYYMEDLGLYQSFDNGETLTSVPVDLGAGDVTPQAIVTPLNTLVITVGGGEFWLRLPGGEWIQYKEKTPELLLEPVTK